MDIEANEKEQLSVAEEILRLFDNELTPESADEIASLAYRLAELVQAANDFKRKANQ